MAKLQSPTKIKQSHLTHDMTFPHFSPSEMHPLKAPYGIARGGAPPHPPEESKWLQNQKVTTARRWKHHGTTKKKRWQHCEVRGYDRDTDLKLERKSKSKKLVLVVSPTKLIVMDELDLEGMVRIFIFNLFNMGFVPQDKWDLNDLQAPYPQGPPNNESKESGTCSNLRVAAIWSCFTSEGSRPVVSHLRKHVPMLHPKTSWIPLVFSFAKSYEHEPWTFFFGQSNGQR